MGDNTRLVGRLGRASAFSLFALAALALPLAAQQADLSVTSIKFTPASPIEGKPVRVEVVAMNGSGTSAPGVPLQWFATDQASAPACSWTTPPMTPGKLVVYTCTYAGYAKATSLSSKAVIDPANKVAESDEANNTKVLAVSVIAPPQPDLTVTALSLEPASPAVGAPVMVRITVANQSQAPAMTSVNVHWIASDVTKQPACSWTVAGFQAGQSREVTCKYNGYAAAGPIHSRAVVDPTGRVQESNETNNYKVIDVTVR